MRLLEFKKIKIGNKNQHFAVLEVDSKTKVQKHVDDVIELDVNEKGKGGETVTNRYRGKISELFAEEYKEFAG